MKLDETLRCFTTFCLLYRTLNEAKFIFVSRNKKQKFKFYSADVFTKIKQSP